MISSMAQFNKPTFIYIVEIDEKSLDQETYKH